jgi:hypothetical protein
MLEFEFGCLERLQPGRSFNFERGPPPIEEDELEYVDPPIERIPRQPVAPDPPLQRRQLQVAVSFCLFPSASP